MTRYIVTGRPVGPAVEELDYHGVGTELDLDLTSEREAELLDRRVIRKVDDTDDTQEETPDASTGSDAAGDADAGVSEPESAAVTGVTVDPEPEPVDEPAAAGDGSDDAAAS